jgi:hypothetical protein
MALAIKQVRDDHMSMLQAAITYGIPRTTLLDKVSGRVPEEGRPGPGLAIPMDEERMLAQHIKQMARAGFPYTRKTLLYEVKSLLDKEQRVVPCFKDNLPGTIL